MAQLIALPGASPGAFTHFLVMRGSSPRMMIGVGNQSGLPEDEAFGGKTEGG
jgi:hypothetical protein